MPKGCLLVLNVAQVAPTRDLVVVAAAVVAEAADQYNCEGTI